ncbi:type II toxin-antitoxin system VapC family toxin [Streptomyces sp. NPDC048416]|uniref:type II toxin-antitoxin system VapC family toxin n=1 Tax=Streptomyces sp. NPDC048416 TaxID=3365546 RepID=UPI003723D658
MEERAAGHEGGLHTVSHSLMARAVQVQRRCCSHDLGGAQAYLWVRDTRFTGLPLTAGHGVRAGRLPALHRDPFDRILVAQAQIEGMTLVTRDQWIPKYDVPVMPV